MSGDLTNYLDEIKTILNEKTERLKSLNQSIRKKNNVQKCISSSEDFEKADEHKSEEYNSLVLANKNPFLSFKPKINYITSLELKNKDKCSKKDLEDIESSSPEHHKRFFRYFKNFTMFYLFFPNLLYAKDFKEMNPKSFRFKLLQKGSVYNDFIKSLTGLIGAWAVTFLFYFYLRNYSNMNSEQMSQNVLTVFILMMFGLSLKFNKLRCILLLIIPFMATNRGRSIILINCYKSITKILLPNILENLKILSFFYSCNRGLLVRTFLDSTKQSSYFQSTIKAIEKAKEFSNKLEKRISIARRTVKKTLRHVKRVGKTIKAIEKVCTNDAEQTKEKCISAISRMTNKCFIGLETYIIFFSFIDLICAILKFSFIDPCSVFQSLKSACMMAEKKGGGLKDKMEDKTDEQWDALADNVFEPLARKFRFDIEYNYTKNIDSNVYDTYKSITVNISEIYSQRLEFIGRVANLFDYLFPLSFAFVVISAVIYLRKYLKRDKYQNYIIGPRFHEIDDRMINKNEKSLFPLNQLISSKYVDLFDLKLSQSEKQSTISTIVFLIMSLLPVILSLILDKFLVWLIDIINKNLSVDFSIESGSIDIKNKNPVTSLYKILFDNINQFNANQTFSNSECLLEPHIVDPKVYESLQTSIFLLIILACFQEYIKRWRTVFAGCVYPERDQERAAWLYDHLKLIDNKMGIWLKKGNKNQKKAQVKNHSFLLYLKKFSINILYFIFNTIYVVSMYILCIYCFCTIGQRNLSQFYLKYEAKFMNLYLAIFKSKNPKCIKCLQILEQADINFIKCKTTNCKGVYCFDCYNEMDNICKLCKMIILDQDLENNESMEKDSSDCESINEKNNTISQQNSALSFLRELETQAKNIQDIDSSSNTSINQSSNTYSDSSEQYSLESFKCLNNDYSYQKYCEINKDSSTDTSCDPSTVNDKYKNSDNGSKYSLSVMSLETDGNDNT